MTIYEAPLPRRRGCANGRNPGPRLGKSSGGRPRRAGTGRRGIRRSGRMPMRRTTRSPDKPKAPARCPSPALRACLVHPWTMLALANASEPCVSKAKRRSTRRGRICRRQRSPPLRGGRPKALPPCSRGGRPKALPARSRGGRPGKASPRMPILRSSSNNSRPKSCCSFIKGCAASSLPHHNHQPRDSRTPSRRPSPVKRRRGRKPALLPLIRVGQ